MKGYCAVFFIIISCIQSPEFIEVDCNTSEWVKNVEISQVLDQYQYGNIYVFESDWIIEGQVISSDEFGEFYKSLIIQDASGDHYGLNLWLDRRSLYLDFKLGEKLKINLNGLAIGSVYGVIQIGQASGNMNELRPLVFEQWVNHIETTCEVDQAFVHALDERVVENILYELPDIYFDHEIYVGSRNSSDYVHELYQRLECDFPTKVGQLQIDGFNDFKDEKLNAGAYSLHVVAQKKYSRMYFSPRKIDDFLKTSQAACEEDIYNTSLSELNQLENGEWQHFDSDMEQILKLQLVSSDEEGNFKNELILQDEQLGVRILLEESIDENLLNWGGWYLIKLNGMTLFKNDNSLELGYWNEEQERIEELPRDVYNEHIFYTETITPPLENEGLENNTFIRLKNWEFEPQTWGKKLINSYGLGLTNRKVKNCHSNETMLISTYNSSRIGSKVIENNLYDLQGVYSNGRLRLVYSDDITVKENEASCSWEFPKIRITEVADPINDHSARYIELTNFSDYQVNLSHWKILKFINTNHSPSGAGLPLNDLVIGSLESVIIANVGFDKYFNKNADLTSSYISGNGDDVYQLINENGDEIHRYGRIGGAAETEDWVYQDAIVKWINNQWVIKEDARIPEDADPWQL